MTTIDTFGNNLSKNFEIVNDLPVEQQLETIFRNRNSKTPTGPDPVGLEILPESTKKRLEDDNIEISQGYPEIPPSENIPIYVDEVLKIRSFETPYDDKAKNADPEKKALFGAAKEVIHLTKNIGTEIVGLQLVDLTDEQKNELALLVSERVVVFFRNQKLPPSQQKALGSYWGKVEVHPQATHVNGIPGTTVLWSDYSKKKGNKANFANNGLQNWDVLRYQHQGPFAWHTDLVHELQPAGYTHLHLDAIPSLGGDTTWASGYAAYDKLSDEFKNFLDGKQVELQSLHGYIDRNDPLGGPKQVSRVHPLVRTHPVTGWKSLFINRGHIKRIIGVSPVESDLILSYLFDIFEKNADVQVRFNWQPTQEGYGTSAIWDNRVSQHKNIFDYEGDEPRHGTRVTTLAEVPYFDPNSKSQREALGKSIYKWE